MFKGFKEFISRGNMVDMAVGVVMGSAVTSVVNAIVKDLINPLIAMIFGKPNMDNLFNITFNHSTISFGGILSALLNFLVIAVAVYFFIVVPINKFHDFSKAVADKIGISGDDDDDANADKDKQEDSTKADPKTLDLLGRIADDLEAMNKANGVAVAGSSQGVSSTTGKVSSAGRRESGSGRR